MIDSHCHLADESLRGDLDAVVARARRAGLDARSVILEAGNDAGGGAGARASKRSGPRCASSIGVHPHPAHQFADDPEGAATTVRAQFAADAVGAGDRRDRPRLSLRLLAARRAAGGLSRPGAAGARAAICRSSIHTREADEDTLAILRDEGGGERARRAALLHRHARRWRAPALDLGFYISLAGIVTFPKAAELRETARSVPLDRLLTETDSPFLAPVPHRGKRNEPAHVAQVRGRAGAICTAVTPAELARRTTANFHTPVPAVIKF